MLDQESNLVFREVQRWGLGFRCLLVVFLLLAAAVGVFAGVTGMRHEPMELPGVVIAVSCGVLIPLGTAVLIWVIRLETEVRTDGLYVRYFPFHRRFRRFEAEDLSECFARKYRPILEYGGWGIKGGWKGGRAYNVSGNEGVQLAFKNGKRLLIGSKEANKLEAAIRSLMKNQQN
jgi:hypothetical protein